MSSLFRMEHKGPYEQKNLLIFSAGLQPQEGSSAKFDFVLKDILMSGNFIIQVIV